MTYCANFLLPLFPRWLEPAHWSCVSWPSQTGGILALPKGWSLCASAWPSWPSPCPWGWTADIPSTRPETLARASSRLWPGGAWTCSGDFTQLVTKPSGFFILCLGWAAFAKEPKVHYLALSHTPELETLTKWLLFTFPHGMLHLWLHLRSLDNLNEYFKDHACISCILKKCFGIEGNWERFHVRKYEIFNASLLPKGHRCTFFSLPFILSPSAQLFLHSFVLDFFLYCSFNSRSKDANFDRIIKDRCDVTVKYPWSQKSTLWTKQQYCPIGVCVYGRLTEAIPFFTPFF